MINKKMFVLLFVMVSLTISMFAVSASEENQHIQTNLEASEKLGMIKELVHKQRSEDNYAGAWLDEKKCTSYCIYRTT